MFTAIILARCEVFEIHTFKHLETLVIPHKIRTFGSYKVNDYFSALYTLQNVLIVKLANL